MDQVRVRVRASVRVRGVLELNIYSPIDCLLWRNFRETQVRYFIYKMTELSPCITQFGRNRPPGEAEATRQSSPADVTRRYAESFPSLQMKSCIAGKFASIETNKPTQYSITTKRLMITLTNGKGPKKLFVIKYFAFPFLTLNQQSRINS